MKVRFRINQKHPTVSRSVANKSVHGKILCLSLALAMIALELPVAAFAGHSSFNVRHYGATGDGTNMDTPALQKAIDAAAVRGGTVLFPPGIYLSGSLDLRSHVTLLLEQGATLLGSTNQPDYRKVNFHGLLLADNQVDISVTGKGTIDGQGFELAADTERLWKAGKLPDAKEDERPVIINFRHCTNVIVKEITLKNSACWVEDYRDCEHLIVEHVTVRSLAAMNNDGIDLDGCAHVVVRNCDIDSEDDGICIKSEDRVCEDVLVKNCRVRSSCSALKFGTRSSVGFKHITCRNLEIYDTYASAIALEVVDGGEMENILISHIKITDNNNPIFIRLGHRNTNGPVGLLHGVTLSDITAEMPAEPRSPMNKFPDTNTHPRPTLIPALIVGIPGHPVQGVTLKNISLNFGGIGGAPQPEYPRLDDLSKIPEHAEKYPESRMFGMLPAWGFYCRHAEGIKFENVKLKVKSPDYRPALICDDASEITLDGFHVASAGIEPVIVFNDVNGATIHDSPAPPGASAFIKSMGTTQNIRNH